MQQPNGKPIMHAGVPYDAAKAHDYYLRTRKLKGRKTGVAVGTSSGLTKSRSTSYTVDLGGQKIKVSARQLAEQKAYADQRVAGIKKKLHELNAKLKQKMAEARKAEREAKKAPSSSDKAKAARESKQYRDKNKQTLKNKSKQAAAEKTPAKKTASVNDLKKTVEHVKQSLKKAVEQQRALAKATKN